MSRRKLIMEANGCLSRKEDVLLGVPQEIVPAAILFLIMILHINENLKFHLPNNNFTDVCRTLIISICATDFQHRLNILTSLKWIFQ